jgi:hypothetical protein
MFKMLAFTTSANNFLELICQYRCCAFFGVFAPMLVGLGQYVEKCTALYHNRMCLVPARFDISFAFMLVFASNFCWLVRMLQGVLCIFGTCVHVFYA